MTERKNPPRPTKAWDCLASDPQITGARVTVNGKLQHFGMQHVRALQQFVESRDEKLKPIRPSGNLTEDQLKYFAAFGIEFEPAERPGEFHPLTEFTIGKYYREGF